MSEAFPAKMFRDLGSFLSGLLMPISPFCAKYQFVVQLLYYSVIVLIKGGKRFAETILEFSAGTDQGENARTKSEVKSST